MQALPLRSAQGGVAECARLCVSGRTFFLAESGLETSAPRSRALAGTSCDGLCDLRLREERLPLGVGASSPGVGELSIWEGREGFLQRSRACSIARRPRAPPPRPQPRPRLSVCPGIVRRGPAWPLGCVCPPGEKSLWAPTESHLLGTALGRR